MIHSTGFSTPAHLLSSFASSSSQTANKGQFDIHTLEWLQQQTPCDEQPEERLTNYEITWVHSGSGQFSIDSTRHAIAENRLYCVVPGQVRSLHINEAAKGYRLSFSRDFLFLSSPGFGPISRLDAFGAEASIPALEADEEMQDELRVIMRKMEKEFCNFYLLRSEVLSGLLNLLVIYLSRKMEHCVKEITDSKDAELIRRFRLLLKENFTTKKQVADYASELFVTPNYLNRKVKKITGFTASNLIQQQIMMEAKRHAMRSNTSMKEIAYFLGFDDLAHFSKFFKNNCGMNFTSFKKGLELAV